jgi:hypothetical protein
MTIDEAIKFFIGLFLVIAGGALFKYSYNQTRNGSRSEFGYDIKLYYAAAGAILFGIFLIYKSIFN